MYAFGDTVHVDAAVVGDVIAAGSRVNVQGSVAGSVNAAGQEVEVAAETAGSVRAAGQTVLLTGNTGGDFAAAGSEVAVGREAVVGRDLILGGRSLMLDGRVVGRLEGAATTVVIAGTVAGVDISVAELVLEEGSRVDGDLVYTSATAARIDDRAVVTGRVVRREPPQSSPGSGSVASWLRSLGGSLLVGLAALWLMPPFMTAGARALRKSPVPVLVAGLAGPLVLGVLGALFAATAVLAGFGASVVVLLMALGTVLLVLAKVVVGFALGGVLLRRGEVDPRDGLGPALVALLAGVLIIDILSAIPFAGGPIRAAAVVAGFGAGLLVVLRWRRDLTSGSVAGTVVSTQ